MGSMLKLLETDAIYGTAMDLAGGKDSSAHLKSCCYEVILNLLRNTLAMLVCKSDRRNLYREKIEATVQRSYALNFQHFSTS